LYGSVLTKPQDQSNTVVNITISFYLALTV
jgi:hypothetical protein